MFMDGMYLKRKIDNYLISWKENPDRKPLIVKGPRQVGKTESICRFAEENLVPIEVKATRGTAKSLRTLIQSKSYPDIQWGIKLTAGNIGYSDNIYTFPYFCSFLIKDYLKWMDLPKRQKNGLILSILNMT